MAEIETIKVLWPDKGPGTFQINARDFDPQRHKLASEDQAATDQQPATAAASESTKKQPRGRRSRK